MLRINTVFNDHACCPCIRCDFPEHSYAAWFLVNTVDSEKFSNQSLVLNKIPQTELREQVWGENSFDWWTRAEKVGCSTKEKEKIKDHPLSTLINCLERWRREGRQQRLHKEKYLPPLYWWCSQVDECALAVKWVITCRQAQPSSNL